MNRIVSFFCVLLVSLSVSAGTLDKIIVVVNDSVITEREFNTALDAARQQFAMTDIPMPDEEILREQVLQQLINTEVQLQLAELSGVSIENEQLNEAVQSIAERNQLTVLELRKEVEKQGMRFAEYRDSIREEMVVAQLQQRAVVPNVSVSERQVDNFLHTYREQLKKNQYYHVRHVIVPLATTATEAEITATYERAEALLQQDEFDFEQILEHAQSNDLRDGDLGWRLLAALPEVFAEQVINMEVGEVVGPVRAGNGFHLIELSGVRGGVEDMSATVTQVRHILIQPNANQSSQAVYEQLQQIRTQVIDDGVCFSELARQYSQDPGSAQEGGDLGWVSPGELVPPFEEAMDQLDLGIISEPVQTQFGWHLIQVLERAEQDPEEQLRYQTQQLLYQRKYGEILESWLDEIRSQAYIEIKDE